MDISKVVRELMFHLYKCEVAAASIRGAMEAKFGFGKCLSFGESAPWFEAYGGALGELCAIYEECGVWYLRVSHLRQQPCPLQHVPC